MAGVIRRAVGTYLLIGGSIILIGGLISWLLLLDPFTPFLPAGVLGITIGLVLWRSGTSARRHARTLMLDG